MKKTKQLQLFLQIIFKATNGNFKSQDFSPLKKWVLVGL